MRKSGPPFWSVRAAVRWAYFTVRRPLLKNTSIYSVSPYDDDLTATEKRAQAALIVGMSERELSIEQLAYIQVVWLAPGKLSPNARRRLRDMRAFAQAKTQLYEQAKAKTEAGVENLSTRVTERDLALLDAGRALAERDELPFYFTEDAEPEVWRRLMSTVGRQMGSSITGRGMEKLIRRCRGDAIGVHAVRRDLRCDMRTVADFQEKMVRALGSIEQPIVYRLEPGFYDNQWLERQ